MDALWIGLMSGTSADGVDAALVRIGDGPGAVETLAHATTPLPGALRERVQAAIRGKPELRELLRLDVELGQHFAAAALDLLAAAGVRVAQVEGIGSHGQTLAHHPEPGVRASLQVGSAAEIHARTGIPVVSDFRAADLAAGGQGAPLTPFVHLACLAAPGQRRAVLNVGGFTNLTWLDGQDPAAVIGFDPGPGNALLDCAARLASGGTEHFDRDGARAARGQVDGATLELLLSDPYFERPPPKSTGHEHFGADFFETARRSVEAGGGGPDDLLATLTALSVESVARAAERFLPATPDRWLVCGGGVHNATLMRRLAERVAPAPVSTTREHGIDPDAVEAVAFAILGWCAARGRASNLPRVTGASLAVCLGSLTPPVGFAARAGAGPASDA